MKKDKVLRIRISEEDKNNLDEVAKLNEVSSAEYARTVINKNVKKDKKSK